MNVETMKKLCAGLNDEQALALTSDAPRKVVLAGPGSGKTRLLVAQAALWAELHGAARVAVVTYTNAASREVGRRVGEAGVGGLAWCGTLHGLCLDLCRRHGDLVGLPRQVAVMDDAHRLGAARSIARDMGLRVSDKALDALLDDPAIRDAAAGQGGCGTMREGLVALEFHRRCRRSGLLDYSGLLWWGARIARRLDADGRRPFDCLLVDEYQDATLEDAAVYAALGAPHGFVVGDPDQAIYGFRGGRPGLLLDLLRGAEAPGDAEGQPGGRKRLERASGKPGDAPWRLFRLERNHRSAARICRAADALVGHNPGRPEKRTVCARSDLAGAVSAHEHTNPAAELCWLLEQVMREAQDRDVCQCGVEAKGHGMEDHAFCSMGDPLPWGDVAVLARTNRRAREAMEFLEARGVPVARRLAPQVPDDWERAKLLVSVMAAPWNDLLVERYLELAGGEEHARMAAGAARRAMKSINEWLGNKFSAAAPDSPLLASELSIPSLARIRAACRALSGRGRWDMADLSVLLCSGETEAEEAPEGVAVCTAHAAKGREWRSVFVIGMEEGEFPQAKRDTDPEEERRLAFVAFTRAKERLALSWCRTRPDPFRPGALAREMARSRFVGEAGI